MLKLLSDIGLIFLFSSLLVSFTEVLFVSLSLKINLTKTQWIASILLLSVVHAIFKAMLPQVVSPFLFLLYSTIVFLYLFKQKFLKILWAACKYFMVVTIFEVVILMISDLLKMNIESAELNVHNLLLSLPLLFLELLVVLVIYRRRFWNMVLILWGKPVKK